MSGSATPGLRPARSGYGVVVGGTSGSGVILLSLLMAVGLEGAAVIATDAVVSLVTSVIKISVFGLAGVVTAQVIAFAVLIGVVALPGAFLARAFVERMPVHIHTAILDVAVIVGGVVMISSALRQALTLRPWTIIAPGRQQFGQRADDAIGLDRSSPRGRPSPCTSIQIA